MRVIEDDMESYMLSDDESGFWLNSESWSESNRNKGIAGAQEYNKNHKPNLYKLINHLDGGHLIK